jgi:xanthine dehydrogenase YagS FAD-binding subunit
MKPFQYATALTPASAQQLAGEHGAYLAGGNDLLNLMKDYILHPEILVNVKSLPNSNRIEQGPQAWTIGANVTVAEIEDHEGIKQTFPGLQQAAANVASRQIRNVASVGGNLAQHSRCWYYRHRDVPCLKKGGDMCYARHGENKYHSLYTGNTCISPVVSNLSIIFAALDATVIVLREGSEQRMSIRDLYQRAWDNPTANHSLDPGDLILRVEVPVQGRRSAYVQIAEKQIFDWATVSCAAAAKVDGGRLSQVKIALGAVANVPYMSNPANEFLEGKTLDDATITRATELILQRARVQSQNGYKIPIIRALVRQTLEQITA